MIAPETFRSLNENINITDLNITNTSTYTLPSPAVEYASVLLLLLPLFTVIGNCLVVISICTYKELRTVTNYMILSLAIADLLIGLVVMPINISYEVLQYWPYGQTVCDLWHSADVLASTASILNLCIISLDRYWAVMDPICYPRLMSTKRGVQCISTVWICSTIISFPTILWWRSVDEVIPGQCNFTQDTVYLLISSMISFYIPVIVMVAVYTKIFLVIRKKSKQQLTLGAYRGGTHTDRGEAALTQLLANDFELTSLPSTSDLHQYPNSTNSSITSTSPSLKLSNTDPSNLRRLIKDISPPTKKASSLSNENKVARTLGVVLGTFLLFWLPFFVCNLIFALCKSCIKNDMVFIFVTWLGHVNSGVNPVIYALSMKDMRHAFISIVSCRFSKYYNYKKCRNRKLTVSTNGCRTLSL